MLENLNMQNLFFNRVFVFFENLKIELASTSKRKPGKTNTTINHKIIENAKTKTIQKNKPKEINKQLQ